MKQVEAAKQQAREKKEEMLLRLSRNMVVFGRVCVPDMFTKRSPAFHQEVAKALMDPSTRRLNIIAPRGSAKSSLTACVYVLWHIFLQHIFLRQEREPRFIVLGSKTQGHSKRLLRTLKIVLDESTPFKRLFGEWGQATARKWTGTEVIMRDGTLILATGTGQQARGLKEGHRRPSLVLLDDPEDEENTKTEERMEANLEWLLQAIEPAVDSDHGKVVVVGTPQHQRSMVMVLRDKPDWTTLFYQALYEEGGEEKSLWPEKWSVKRLKEMLASYRAIGRVHVFYREYLCNVIQGEDALFKPEYLRYWDGWLETGKDGFFQQHYLHVTHRGLDDNNNPLPLDEEEIIPVHVTMGVDPASSKNRRADHTAIVAVAMAADERVYVLPYVRERMLPLDVAHAIIREYKRYLPAQTRIESVAYQTMIRDYLLRSTEVDVRIPGLGISEKPHEKKETRLEGLHPVVARGLLQLQPSMQALKDEFMAFPAGSSDDLLDGLYYALRGARTPSHTKEEYGREKERRKRRHWDPMLS